MCADINFPPKPKTLRYGCEEYARQILIALESSGQRELEIVRITPKRDTARYLGPVSKAPGVEWQFHEAVLDRANGKIYDAMTGASGMLIDDYKKLFAYFDDINFGF